MGALTYGPGSLRIDIDDDLLAHLQLVITAKLRRRESFLVTVTDSKTRLHSSLWLNDAIALIFEYSSTEIQSVDRSQVEAMMIEAIGSRGLRLDAWEPEKPALAIVDDVPA